MEHKKIDDIRLREFYYDDGDLTYVFTVCHKQVLQNIEIAERHARSLEQINSVLEGENIVLECTEEQYAVFYKSICDMVCEKINKARLENPGVSETKLFPPHAFLHWE